MRCKNYIVGLKRPKINEKEAGDGPFFKKTYCKIIIFDNNVLPTLKVLIIKKIIIVSTLSGKRIFFSFRALKSTKDTKNPVRCH